MEPKNSLIKSIDEFKLEGYKPQSRLFFCLEQSHQNELIIHGGCNSTELFNGLYIVDFSIFIF